MYKAKIWDEDKDTHAGTYNSSKYGIFSADKKEQKNHEQKYGAKEKGAASDYMRKEEQKAEEENKASGIFGSSDEEKKGQEAEEGNVTFKAAKQIFNEGKHGAKKTGGRKEIKTIEDAIKKAIEDGKKVVVMDN